MEFLKNLFNIGGNNEIITELKSQVEGLEKILQSDFPLAGVDDGNYITYNTSTNNYYNTNYAVNRAINLLSNNIASLPLKLYRGEQELPIDYVFPNGFSFIKPNTGMSLNELLYTTCIYYFYQGEFCQQIITEDGPVRLVPLNPKNLTRNQDGSWKLNKKNRITIIQEEYLIYTAFLNPEISTWTSNCDRGLSPVDVVKAELKNDAAACNYSTKYFENFAKLGGVLTDKDGNITSDQMKKLVIQFNASHQNQNKAYKTLGLPKGIAYEDISQTLREMDFLSSRKDIRDRILIVLGVHPALLGITETVNRSVAEEAGRQLWSQTLRPAAIRISEKYNQQFLNPIFPGYSVKFDFSDVKELQENMESLLKQASMLQKMGYTLNEVNTHLGLGMEEITEPEGDIRLFPRIMTTLDQITVQTPPKEPVTPKKGVLEKATDLLDSIDSNNVNKQDKDYRQSYLRKRAPLETKFTSKMKRYFFEQRKEVLAIMARAKHPHNITNDLGKFFIEEDERIKKTTEPLYIEGVEVGIDLAEAQFKVVSNNIDKDISEELVMGRVNKITGINDTVYNEIKLNLYEGLKEGESTDQIAKRIKNVYNMASTRAKTISRTETGGIINDSTAAEYKKKGVERIMWQGGQRPEHSKVNGTTVVMGELFANQLRWPGDTGSPGSTPANLCNCRCCFSAVISDS